MTGGIDIEAARSALIELPEGTSHGAPPHPAQVYLPPSHRKAMDPDAMLVTGMRGAGKTFWWTALQDPTVREFVYRPLGQLAFYAHTEVRTGFGVRPDPDRYPDKDVLKALLSAGREPRTIWRAVQVWQIAPDDHPIRRERTWQARADWVESAPEAVARLFQDADDAYHAEGKFLLVLFDALDRCSDDWKDMYRLIRGLMQTALDMRSYRRLRVKMFLRTDQVDESRIADFPDASKVLSSSVELGWPARELYGLLWQHLVNRPANGDVFRDFLGHGTWSPVKVGGQAPGTMATSPPPSLFQVPRKLIADEELQRGKFHAISGPWMGRNAKRGLPYTWIPNHLGDTGGRVSPRSFLEALRVAARDTAEHYPDHRHALHFESIKRGVQKASRIRVAELREDYPWMHRVLEPLAGMTVPCKFWEIKARWEKKRVLGHLTEEMEQDAVKLPPLHVDDGEDGIREDLESLGVFQRLRDGRVNIPDVFRVGYGLGRKGGVRPVR